MDTNNYTILKWVNLIAFILTVLVNSLAGDTTILGGKTPHRYPDRNPTLITPAGYVFSIWGTIYISLGIFVISSLIKRKTRLSEENQLAVCLKQLF